MKYWDWEFFDTAITADMYSVIDCGPLFGPVTDFKLERNDELDLILVTTSSANSTSNAVERVAGEVYQTDAEVKLESRTSHAVALGVTPRGHTKTWGAQNKQATTKERASIESLEWTSKDAPEPDYIIEWVGNMDSFIWPDFDDRTKDGEERRVLKSPKREITLSAPIKSGQHSRSCAHLVVEGIELFVGESKAKPEHVVKPGFILYVGTPDEETRAKIRNCLSFCLGTYLLYLGNTKFDSEWSPVAFIAKSGHALVKEAPDLSGYLPSPLSLKWENAIAPELLERMVSSLYKIYDAYELRSTFWSYWHAMAAPLHMRAVHFGAAIESLQSKFLKKTPEVHRLIVEDTECWSKLHDQISARITEAALTDDAKTLLISKAKNLNYAPQSIVMERFFASLKLKIGKLEKSAWSNRNHAAHGGRTTDSNVTKMIRENKVLHIMMNRILLALGGGADHYYDYYTLGRPTRVIIQSIPDDKVL